MHLKSTKLLLYNPSVFSRITNIWMKYRAPLVGFGNYSDSAPGYLSCIDIKANALFYPMKVFIGKVAVAYFICNRPKPKI